MKQQKNTQLAALIDALRRHAVKADVKLWRRIASDLERPSRKQRVVNLYKIQKCAKENETLIVPGKVLGTGELTLKVNVAAFSFSDEARQKITAKGKALSIPELLKENPKGQKVRILG